MSNIINIHKNIKPGDRVFITKLKGTQLSLSIGDVAIVGVCYGSEDCSIADKLNIPINNRVRLGSACGCFYEYSK